MVRLGLLDGAPFPVPVQTFSGFRRPERELTSLVFDQHQQGARSGGEERGLIVSGKPSQPLFLQLAQVPYLNTLVSRGRQ
jgi:hypothetical protein